MVIALLWRSVLCDGARTRIAAVTAIVIAAIQVLVTATTPLVEYTYNGGASGEKEGKQAQLINGVYWDGLDVNVSVHE